VQKNNRVIRVLLRLWDLCAQNLLIKSSSNRHQKSISPTFFLLIFLLRSQTVSIEKSCAKTLLYENPAYKMLVKGTPGQKSFEKEHIEDKTRV